MLEVEDFTGIVKNAEVHADQEWYYLQVRTSAKFRDVAFGYSSTQSDYLCNILSHKGATVAQIRVTGVGKGYTPFLSKHRYGFDVLLVCNASVRR